MKEAETDISSETVFDEHPLRSGILGEVHARPFPLLKAPLQAVHLAFVLDKARSADLGETVAELYRARGAKPPAPGARYHRVPIDLGTLRWEQHGEFTTFAWNSKPSDRPMTDVVPRGPFGDGFRQPGPLLTAMRLAFLPDPGEAKLQEYLNLFDPRSLIVSSVADGQGLIATDLQQDPQGYTRYLVIDRGMSEGRAGSIILRLQEIETYRTLTLLGLPAAHELSPSVARMEGELGRITDAIRVASGMEANRDLLGQLTTLAGELEADVAKIAYRMGATKAYDEIMKLRLAALEEKPLPGFGSLQQFLSRRMGPAMRTCLTIEKRQEALAEKLARTIELLRARVDIDLEQQNSELLSSMNRRADLQLRLQQTVEGLSIGAVSYYLLGIVGYVAKGLKASGLLPVAPEVLVGLFVPIVLGLVFWTTQRIKKKHAEGGHH